MNLVDYDCFSIMGSMDSECTAWARFNEFRIQKTSLGHTHTHTHTHTLSPTRRIAPIILCKENYTCQIKYKVQVLAQQ